MSGARVHRAEMDEDAELVLLYLHNGPMGPQGFTTKQVCAGTGFNTRRATQVLERLYTSRKVGRQKALFGADQASYWLPLPPTEPLELAGPPSLQKASTSRCPCGRALDRADRAICALCAQRGPAWGEFSETDLKVMRLVDTYGDDGMPFEHTSAFGRDAIASLQHLQRQGILGVDLHVEVWRFGIKGREIFDAYAKEAAE